MNKGLKIGDDIPEVTLKDQEGHLIDLTSFKGKHSLVVYFYPKDDTPGCTLEACSFRDRYDEFEEAGAKVIGISGDSVGSHSRFASRHGLNFMLLSDINRVAEKEFGVPRNLLGLLPGRVTYVFNKEGKLVSTFSSAVKATKHIKESLKALSTCQ